jgi:hypothetical protein
MLFSKTVETCHCDSNPKAWQVSLGPVELSPNQQAQSTPRLCFCSLCLRVCSLSVSHNQMSLTVPTNKRCCCLTCVRATFSRKKNQLVDWVCQSALLAPWARFLSGSFWDVSIHLSPATTFSRIINLVLYCIIYKRQMSVIRSQEYFASNQL